MCYGTCKHEYSDGNCSIPNAPDCPESCGGCLTSIYKEDGGFCKECREKMGLEKTAFKEGQLIIYKNGDRYEIGKIKRLTDNGAFVCYHEGDTAAKTPFECMFPLVNAYCIKGTTLGGK